MNYGIFLIKILKNIFPKLNKIDSIDINRVEVVEVYYEANCPSASIQLTIF